MSPCRTPRPFARSDRFPPSPRSLGIVVAGVLALSSLATAPLTHAATAVSGEQTVLYDIPAGPLPPAITRFVEVSGIYLAGATDLASGKHSPGVAGRLTIRQGFAALLAGTDLEAVERSAGEYVLIRRSAPPAPTVATLPRVQVQAAEDIEPTDASSYVARRSSVGSRIPTEVIEVPQTINIVTRAQMDAQGAQSVEEMLHYTPGVVTGVHGGATYQDYLYLRGFSSPQYLDGMRLPYGLRGYAQLRIEPYGLDRVELLKGPASVLYGQSAPGGLANSVRKRPQATTVHELRLLAGSYDRVQGAFDIGGALDQQAVLSYRLTGLARESGTQVDHTRDDRVFVAPALTWQPSEDTILTLLTHYQEDTAAFSKLHAQGTLLPNVNGRIPTRTFLSYPDFDGYEREQYSVGYDFEHRASGSWTLRHSANYSNIDNDFRYVNLGALQADQRTSSRSLQHTLDTADALTLDAHAQVDFVTGVFEHTAVAGASYWRLTYDSYWAGMNAGTVDIFNPSYTGRPAMGAPTPDQDQTQHQTGFYLNDRIRSGRWVTSLGLRYDTADSRNFNANSDLTTRQDDDALTGRAGVVYLFDSGFAPFIGFASSFEPTAGSDAQGVAFDPTTARQYEIGLRYQPPGTQLSVSLSAFELTQRNVLTQDPNPPDSNPWAQVQTGEMRVEGVELDTRWNVGNGLDLVASYGYTDSEITRTNTPAQLGNELQRTPRQQATLWADYTVQRGALAGFGVGAGVRYFGSSYGDLDNQLELPSYSLVDATLHLDIGQLTPALAGLTARAHATNLFDKIYVASCASALSANCYYGNRRALLLTLQYQW